MNAKKIEKKWLYILLVIIFVLALTSACGEKPQKPSPEASKDKIPKSLENMVESSKKVFDDIEKIEDEIEKPLMLEEVQQKEEDKGQGGKQQEQGGQQGGSQQGGGEEQKPKEATEKPQEEKDKMRLEAREKKIYGMWEATSSEVEKLHQGWNEYENSAIKDGASNEDINRFEDTLDALTIAVANEEINNALRATNELDFSLGRFYDFYKGHNEGDMLRIKHYTMKAYLDGKENKWPQASEDIQKAMPQFEQLRQKIKLDKKDEGLLDKLKHSIENVDHATEEESVKLLKIKRDLVMKNLDELKDAAK